MTSRTELGVPQARAVEALRRRAHTPIAMLTQTPKLK